MDTLTLKTFVQVAQDGSFSQAAERLHISQPAVSKRIANLEAQLQAKLLDRVGRQIMLTDAGLALLPYAEQTLITLEDARRRLSQLHSEVHGALRIGTSHHIGLHRLPPVLREFSQRYPQVELDIQFMDSEQACDAVLAGSLEIGIVTLPPRPQSHLSLIPIWPDPLDVMVGNTHPLAQRKRIGFEQLAKFPAVLPDEQTYTHRIIRDAMLEHKAELNIRLATNYLETIKMLVSIGMGWSLLPRSMLDASLQRLDVPQLKLQRELGIVRHQARAESSAGKALIELTQSIAIATDSD